MPSGGSLDRAPAAALPPPAQLAARFTTDAATIREALTRAVNGIADAVTVIGLVGSMIYLDWLLSLIAAALYPLAALPIRPVLPPREGHGEARAALAVQALRALTRRQLLSALREDGFGALALNAWIEQYLKQAWGVPPERTWYAGRAVLVTRNDYAARLYNGDVGLCLAEPDGTLRVWFEAVDEHGRASARSLAPGTLPPHEGGFAITVHKSQGSEYERAAVLLPPDPQHRILSRQLLYTGLSRARRDVELWSTPDAVAAALARPVQRAGGLAARLLRKD